MSQPAAPSLPAYAWFAAVLYAAGLPIYLHAPDFYAEEYGVGLTAMASVLFVLRLLDFGQDPALGWLASKTQNIRRLTSAIAVAILGASMIGLFAISPPIAPLAWFAIMLVGLFSSFSFLYICFYSQGVITAARMPGQGHFKLAGWRESGALVGICAASVAPTVLQVSGSEMPFALFALGYGVAALLAIVLMHSQWNSAKGAGDAIEGGTDFGLVLRDPTARRLLLIAFANAAPVAVSSTLFLFFVEDRLEAPGWEGPLLLLFFVAAAGSAPVWSRIAQRIGARNALATGMVLAIAAFSSVPLLGPGDAVFFAVVCLVSGATLGADFTLLPAIFARRMAEISPDASAGFGIWSFMSKFTLAFAAILVLPALDQAGYTPGGDSPESALALLSLLYAGIPCILKLISLALLWTTDLPEPEPQTQT
ncbi:MAG: MFS transporter [Pseudomonadota bacterium]